MYQFLQAVNIREYLHFVEWVECCRVDCHLRYYCALLRIFPPSNLPPHSSQQLLQTLCRLDMLFSNSLSPQHQQIVLCSYLNVLLAGYLWCLKWPQRIFVSIEYAIRTQKYPKLPSMHMSNSTHNRGPKFQSLYIVGPGTLTHLRWLRYLVQRIFKTIHISWIRNGQLHCRPISLPYFTTLHWAVCLFVDKNKMVQFLGIPGCPYSAIFY